jgi:hypothetical protein
MGRSLLLVDREDRPQAGGYSSAVNDQMDRFG